MKFLADGMLGGLTRWLRMIGCEVQYEKGSDDQDLLSMARDRGMTLLTGDEELAKRAGFKRINCLLVHGRSEEERLAEVASAFGLNLDIEMDRTRCPECGDHVRIADKGLVVDKVPESSWKLYNEFWVCNNSDCGQVYWKGSHWRQIHKTLDAAKRIARHSSG